MRNLFSVNRIAGVLSLIVLFTSLPNFSVYTAHAADSNLISNPGLETPSTTSPTPEGWIRGRWGTNTTTFSYPVQSNDGSRAARVTMTSWTTGDAKWTFTPVPITPQRVYEYQDDYSSDVSTVITLEIGLSDGRFIYPDIIRPSASGWTTETVNFTAPDSAQSVRVFHLLNRVGTLAIDNVSLRDVTPAPSPTNPIKNPSFAETDLDSLPSHWLKGRWGSNSSTFTFPVPGRTDTNAARVELSQHLSGDAKWYFEDIPVLVGGWYQFSDYYQSSIPQAVTVRFQKTDGTFSYQDIGFPAAQSGWTQFSGSFNVPPGVVSATVFHLINMAGWLTVDDYNVTKLPGDPMAFSKGYVSLNFDDGWLSAYQNAIPIMNTAGFKSTQFIITGRMRDGFADYVKIPQILDMQSHNHEIGAHTRTHPDLTAIPIDQAQVEISGSKNDLLDIGVTPVNFFAYPEGGINTSVQQLVRDTGFLGARGSYGGYNKKNTDKFNLVRQPMTNTTTIDQVKSMIDQAVLNKTWLILLFHEVNTSGHAFAVTPQLFQQITDYLKTKNITPITLTQGLALMN